MRVRVQTDRLSRRRQPNQSTLAPLPQENTPSDSSQSARPRRGLRSPSLHPSTRGCLAIGDLSQERNLGSRPTRIWPLQLPLCRQRREDGRTNVATMMQYKKSYFSPSSSSPPPLTCSLLIINSFNCDKKIVSSICENYCQPAVDKGQIHTVQNFVFFLPLFSFPTDGRKVQNY